MEFLEVGKIINTHGLRGDVKVVAWTDLPEDFEDIPVVYIKKKTGDEKLTVSKIKYQKNNLIVKFKEINDRYEKMQNKIDQNCRLCLALLDNSNTIDDIMRILGNFDLLKHIS